MDKEATEFDYDDLENEGEPAITQELIGEMNEVEIPDEPEQPEKIDTSLLDEKGEPFNPEIHRTDETGTPIKTKGGLWSKKRKRRSTIGKGKAAEQVNADQAQLQERQAKAESHALGYTTAMLIFTSCRGIGGEEWKPSDEESSVMVDAWSNYFFVTGKKDLPPSLMIVAACTFYAIPRFTMPQTQGRIKKLVGKVKSFKFKRKKVQPEPEKKDAA